MYLDLDKRKMVLRNRNRGEIVVLSKEKKKESGENLSNKNPLKKKVAD